jgi:hypothetical protein
VPLALTTVFAHLPDPRREPKNNLNRFTDNLVIATCAVIAGAAGSEQVTAYGKAVAMSHSVSGDARMRLLGPKP